MFLRKPNQGDWKSFSIIARRIRSFGFSCTCTSDYYTGSFSFNAFLSVIAVTRPPGPVLPALRKLFFSWTPNPPPNPLEQYFLPLFLHEGLQTLSLDFDGFSALYTFSSQGEDIAAMAPFLEHLILNPVDDFLLHKVEADLTSLLKQLSSLRTISLPPYSLTGGIIGTLSALGDLESIKLLKDDIFPLPIHGYTFDFTVTLHACAFPALRELSLCAGLADVQQLLSHPHFPSEQLTQLAVRAVFPETQHAIRDFFNALAEEAGFLTDLTVVLMSPTEADGTIWSFQHCPIPFTCIHGVQKLQNLQRLVIRHEDPLSITDDEIKLLAQSLPQIEVLHLICDPDPDHPTTDSRLSLGALIPFAMHCPLLVELGLYLNASLSLSGLPKFVPRRFHALQHLYAGTWTITPADRHAVALFLSRILSHSTIVYDTGPGSIYDEYYLEWEQDQMQSWSEVVTLLSVIMQARSEAVEEHSIGH